MKTNKYVPLIALVVLVATVIIPVSYAGFGVGRFMICLFGVISMAVLGTMDINVFVSRMRRCMSRSSRNMSSAVL